MKPGIPTSLVTCAAMLLSFPSTLLAEPTPMGGRKAKHGMIQATTSARMIGLMLVEFDMDYGSFPSEKTRAMVEETSGVKLPDGDQSANALLRQLFAAGVADKEDAFYAPIPGAKKGDNITDPNKVLEQGENAFAYIAGLSTAGNPSRPLLVCPLIPGTTRFDPKPFGDKAIILRVDCSVKVIPITKDGKVLMDGVDILSKDHPIWDGKAPDVRHPELLPVK